MKQDETNKISGPIAGLNLTGVTVVVKASHLAPEYRQGDRRLLCESGFGCYPVARGKAVFGQFRGEPMVRFDRSDIEGVAAHSLKLKTTKPEKAHAAK